MAGLTITCTDCGAQTGTNGACPACDIETPMAREKQRGKFLFEPADVWERQLAERLTKAFKRRTR